MGSSIRPISGVRVGTAAAAASTTSATIANAFSTVGTRQPAANLVIDVNKAPDIATVVRGNTAVETPAVNLGRASAILENFVPILHLQQPRGVRQSIAKGTLVTRGTSVDVDFLTPDLVTLGIFDGVHADLQARNPAALATLLGDPEVSPLLQKATADLTAAERTNLTAKLAANNIGVDDAVPERSLGAAVTGLKTALAFR